MTGDFTTSNSKGGDTANRFATQLRQIFMNHPQFEMASRVARVQPKDGGFQTMNWLRNFHRVAAYALCVDGETILLSRPRDACVFCGSTRSLVEHRSRGVCRPCVAELAAET
jgi:hypothetical protein